MMNNKQSPKNSPNESLEVLIQGALRHSTLRSCCPGGCTTKLAEQIRAFLGNPGLLKTKLAIRVKRFHEAQLRVN